jgi:hypothetical protein
MFPRRTLSAFSQRTRLVEQGGSQAEHRRIPGVACHMCRANGVLRPERINVPLSKEIFR